MLREVNHRSKNLLSVVQVIARLTARGVSSEFTQQFEERLQALAANQDLLVKGGWKPISLKELVHTQLAHLESVLGTRIVLDGADVNIEPSAAQALGMALHELATNASKYGALSNATGRVAIAWNCRPTAAGERRFELKWSESGGPTVCKSGRRGFGSTVLEDVIKGQLRAAVALDLRGTGLIWSMTCPAEAVLAPSGNTASPISGRNPRVLVVEDEVLIALEITQSLKSSGFDVVGPAHSLDQAMHLLQEHSGCDFAILDVTLGRDTAEPIAAQLSESQTPFLVVTGLTRTQLNGALKAAPLLSKPVRLSALIKAVRDHLGSPTSLRG